MKRKYLRKCCDKFCEKNKKTGRTFCENVEKTCEKMCDKLHENMCDNNGNVAKVARKRCDKLGEKCENVVNMFRKIKYINENSTNKN